MECLFEKEKVLIGSFPGPDEERFSTNSVYINVKVVEVQREAETIDHEKVDKYTKLSISGLVSGTRLHEHSRGQVSDTVALVTDFANGFNAEKLQTLLKIWDEYHLNDLQAGCSHQDSDAYDTMDERLEKIPPCPETGYKYGHSWLLKKLPEDIVEQLTELF